MTEPVRGFSGNSKNVMHTGYCASGPVEKKTTDKGYIKRKKDIEAKIKKELKRFSNKEKPTNMNPAIISVGEPRPVTEKERKDFWNKITNYKK